MRIKLRQIGFLILLISAIVITSCSWGSSDSGPTPFRIIDHETFVENTDVLFMMYMDGDNNLNDTAWWNIAYAQLGLVTAEAKNITVIALVDGNKYKTKMTSNGPEGNGKSYLLKLGGYSQDEYTTTESDLTVYTFISKNSKDYSKSVNWIYNYNHEVDMSSGNTLYYFLTWAKTHFNANKTILAVQNHGGGPYNELTSSISSRSICWDDTNHPDKKDDSHLSTTDVATAINRTFGKIDMLVEDVCLQCSIEEIYGLQDAVHYLVASPNTTFGNQLSYDKIIIDAGNGLTIEEIGTNFVDYNYENCKEKTLRDEDTSTDDPTCMELSCSLVDCSNKNALNNIKKLTSELAEALLEDTEHNYIDDVIGKLPLVHGKFYGLCFDASYVYTQDLGIMAYMLANFTPAASSDVKSAASALFTELKNNSLILYAWAGGSEHSWYYSADESYGEDEDFRISSDGKCPWGISITAERFTKTNEYGQKLYGKSLENYRNWSKFAQNNKWADFLKAYKNGD